MPVNYVLISEQTVSQSVTSVTFSNIPQTGYTDLKVVWSARGTDNTSYNYITFNSGVGSGRLLYAETSGSTVASFSQSVIQPISSQSYPTVTANTFANCEMYIPNYSVAGVAKSVSVDGVTGSAASSGVLGMQAYITATTSAITTMTIKQGGASDSGTFLPGSTFYIYGIAAFGTTPTILPKAICGDIIANDGTYWYHAFLSSGVFTPSSALTCSVLQIAGGAGGNRNNGGGGGAGGVLGFASEALTAINYPVTVGGGGTAGSGTVGGSGSNSQFASLTASVGGGGGGARGVGNAVVGGSGGGGASDSTSYATGAIGTTGQGNSGGNGADGGDYRGGGGGGAGANGNSAGSNGNGGAGTNSVTNWGALSAVFSATSLGVSGYIAGGGGAGANYNFSSAGGSGGGGAGGRLDNTTNGSPGVANTGSGGGSCASGQTAGAGGSGVVIVRYTMA